ncbi:MAG TPA: TetR family transcriptional regulator [Stellaceae bacterium]|nr:TetR family transcriptional regulator [Stellaceae bacterium]
MASRRSAKTRTAKRVRRARPARRAAAGDSEGRIVEAALDLAARQGWRRTGLGEIAAGAGLSLAELHGRLRSRGAILMACMRYFDRLTLTGAEDASGTPREKLFELLMRRFDALKPHRKAIAAMCRDSIGDPAALLGFKGLMISMGWMLEAAGVPTAGLPGRARRKLLALVYLSVLVVFVRDESDDLAKTMATLDRRLGMAESWLGLGAPSGPAQ